MPHAPGELATFEAELARLGQILDASSGTFSLTVAVCNDLPLRAAIADRIRATHPAAAPLSLPPQYEDLLAELERAAPADCTALLVTNVEGGLSSAPPDTPSGAAARRVLIRLNGSRELWRARFAYPVVLLVPQYAAGLIMRFAPDWWSWVSHHLQFTYKSAGGESDSPLKSISTDDESHLQNLDATQLQLRLAELRERVADYEVGAHGTAADASAWYNELGLLYERAGQPQPALSALRSALEIEKALTQRPELRAQRLQNLAGLLSRLGQRDEAAELVTTALQLSRAAQAVNPGSMWHLRDLSVSLNKVGDVRLAAGDRGAALAAYEEGLEIRRRILSVYGQTPQSLRDLSLSLNRVGDVRRAAGDRGAALAAYEEGLEISRRILGDYGQTPESLRDLSISLDRVGDVRLAAGDRGAALAAYDEGLEIRRRVLGDYGQTPESLRDLSVSLDRVGDVRLSEGDRGAALAAYEEGLEIRRRILRDYGQTPVSLRDLGVSLANAALCAEGDGDLAAALGRYLEAREQIAEAVRRWGEVPQLRDDLARLDERIAACRADQG